MAARRRDILRELVRNAGRLRQEGDVEFADQVDRYISELPPLDTESRHLQRELVQQVQRRLRERTQDNSKNRLK
jgi:hypothetical protein